ncbi:hypothetical protein EG328_003447 [Venturia inaequalis]|uniref:Uncharacterized protein n=1 Tax=Venturia inaequalis TaxID=5025 RepID=A0A8H3VM27_VENIN|nr:hypothetical protein EG328_003447 [Venturia inaequalis]KAE9990148.1 hypothetical protein EG327_001788 [Venturia inaequalis]
MAVTPDTQNDSKFLKSHMRMCKSTPAPSYSSRLLPFFSEQTTFIKPHPQEYKICHQAAFLPPTPILPPPLGASRYTAVLLHFNLHGVASFIATETRSKHTATPCLPRVVLVQDKLTSNDVARIISTDE